MKFHLIAKIIFSLAIVFGFANNVFASEINGTIITGGSAGYAWSDQAGWVNFGATNGNIIITDSGITGYVWSNNYGWINMAPTNGGVAVAANGALSGNGWGSGLGWINFSGVSINSSGKFTGQATGSLIGALTFDCANCNVSTDYRPQNFRTTTATTAAPSSGGGGGGGGGGGAFIPMVSGPGGQSVPAHIDAYNVPMKLFPTQSGALTQNFGGNKIAKIETPNNIFSDEIILDVSQQIVSADAVVLNAAVVGESLFDVVARYLSSGNLAHIFSKPIAITLTIPERLQNRNDIGVYYFDEANKIWVKVPDVVFNSNSAIFSVNHLTLFGIFSAPGLPSFLNPTSFISKISSQSTGGGITSGLPFVSSASSTAQGNIPSKLFDINLEIDKATIGNIDELNAKAIFVSFGKIPTPVDLTFTILDSNGKEIHRSKDKIVVETEFVFKKQFKGLGLAPGKYTVVLTTLYNVKVKDEFKKKFEIVGAKTDISFWKTWWFWILIIIFIAIIILIIKNKKYEQFHI